MVNHLHNAYDEAYQRLNEKQKQAVDSIEGPVMVIAGPGTGKTQILTLRIANILRQTQMDPENILALTFTKSGAKAMRERLFSFIGNAAYRVPIFTFHGLAEKLIREYPEAYTKIIGSKPATDIEKIEIIETILEEPSLRVLRPTGARDFYVAPLLSIISSMKQENVRPDDLALLISDAETTLTNLPRYHEKGAHKGKERSEYTKLVATIEKQQALLIVYRQYEALMRERQRYDFDDMIIETVRVLEDNESVRLDLQETYQYILADEHQDVNGAQNAILVALTSYHDNPNLFVVGDEKQAIYRFQGASLENFLYFETLFSSTTVIALTHNYRSTQAILDLSHELIKVADGPLVDYRIPLTSHNPVAPQMAIVQCVDEQQEHAHLLTQVQDALTAGVPPHEIAVIVRSNREVEQIAELLAGVQIPVEASADGDILEHPLFLGVVDLLELVLNPADMALLSRVLLLPYTGISASDAARVLASVSYDQPLIACISDPAWLRDKGVTQVDSFASFLRILEVVREGMLTTPPHRLLATLLTTSGLFTTVAGFDPLESSRVIRRLYDEVEALVRNGEAKTLSEVVGLLRRRMSYRVPLLAPYVQTSTASVKVMTAHKSKGLEFDTVIIPHVTEANWGRGRRADYFKVPLVKTASLALEANEDERRLLYVAITRAKRVVAISYADTSSDGKVLTPSEFLAVLTDAAVVKTAPAITAVAQLPLAVSVSPDRHVLQQILVRTLSERGLSATSLNNCIKNPWHYLYRNVFHIPEVQALPMLFGTAMHGVLESVTKEYSSTGHLPDFTTVRTRLLRELGKLPLGTLEYTDLLEKGQEVLAVYLPHLKDTLPPVSRAELSVKVMLPTKHPLVPLIPLTGKLDRIDMSVEGSAIRVVDYKTGKPKTRNEIEGKTAKADASYRRQLSFYSLLLHLQEDERYRTDVGVLSFIEADTKGLIHEESYVSGEVERQELIDLITETIDTIVRGDFLVNHDLLAESDYEQLGRILMSRLK